jgi:hypothetical protein
LRIKLVLYEVDGINQGLDNSHRMNEDRGQECATEEQDFEHRLNEESKFIIRRQNIKCVEYSEYSVLYTQKKSTERVQRMCGRSFTTQLTIH